MAEQVDLIYLLLCEGDVYGAYTRFEAANEELARFNEDTQAKMHVQSIHLHSD